MKYTGILLLLVLFYISLTDANAVSFKTVTSILPPYEYNTATVFNDSKIRVKSGQTDDTLYVREFVLSMDVIEREPVDIVSAYSMADERAWCFARLYNSEAIQEIYFKWYYEDDLYFEMPSKIGLSNNWRSYSSATLLPGSWRVELVNKDGETLKEILFDVNE